MPNICIFCKEPITKINDEHIIPDAILGNPSKTENILKTNDVCITCNNKRLGAGVDNEFLNHDEVKAVRLLHRRFLNKETNPKLILKSITSFCLDGIDYPCDLYIDKNGHKFVPSKVPIKNGKSVYFIRNENEIDDLIEKLNLKPNYDKLTKSSFKFTIKGDIDLYNLILNKFNFDNFQVPFSRIFFKMIIEYISYKFGKSTALKSQFDSLRDLALKRCDKWNSKYRVRVIGKIPYEVDKLPYVEHSIGIKYNKQESSWIFIFCFYKLYEYSFLIPADDTFIEVTDIVRIYS